MPHAGTRPVSPSPAPIPVGSGASASALGLRDSRQPRDQPKGEPPTRDEAVSESLRLEVIGARRLGQGR